MEPLEPYISHFEHCKEMFLALSTNNIKYPLEVGPGDVAQERGELLYHLLCYVFTDGCLIQHIFIVNYKELY
jgi:hypothetical protein